METSKTLDELLNSYNFPLDQDIGELHPTYLRFKDLTFQLEQLFGFAAKNELTYSKARLLASSMISRFLKEERNKLRD